MPITPTYPGVYVQEVPSGVRTIVGVSTSTTLFIGSCKDGPMDTPVQCLSYTEFVKNFSEDTSVSDLPRYVKLYFLNGGTTAWVMRIANLAQKSSVQLKAEGGGDSLSLTAKNAGAIGDTIRLSVNYDSDQPESTFNMEIFRWTTNNGGTPTKSATETWRNLSMNPGSALYAPTFLTQNSSLVDAAVGVAPAAGTGFSQAGRAADMLAANFAVTWGGILTATANQFQISVAGSAFQQVDLSALAPPLPGATPATEAALIAGIQAAVRAVFNPGHPGQTAIVTTVPAPSIAIPPGADTRKWLRITIAGGDVLIRPAPVNDVAVRLMLGTDQGGFEVGAYAAFRPAQTGLSLDPTKLFGDANAFAALVPANILRVTLDGTPIDFNPAIPGPGLQTVAGHAMDVDAVAPASSPNGNGDGIREKLRLIAQVVNVFASSHALFRWTASVTQRGYRLNFVRTDGLDNAVGTLAFPQWLAPAGFADFENVRYYSLGASGTGPFQTPGPAGNDGNVPKPSDYELAYPIVDREVDIFNLMALPSASGVTQNQLWGAASVFCQKRRAFLLMDGELWPNASAAATGISTLRIGLVKDYSAVYYPRLTISENGVQLQLGPTGAIAGLMARTDNDRGVWKAPAGTEADIRGIVGLEKRFSDDENGLLNPRAINTLRVFPSGVVCWGARTAFGDDSEPNDYKYVPVRRLALFMEESLYRGLKWVVFEPNDEPLWAQIRLNVGAFMHGLFTQGAFQGKKASDAYFVRCDGETTTQDDRNKGIVNIWVGFAPLKPAEFVVLYLQQMAGQIAV